MGLEFTLTDKQINALDRCTDKFRAAGYRGREQIVENAFNAFQKAWPKRVHFNKDVVRAVGVQLAILNCSSCISSLFASGFIAK